MAPKKGLKLPVAEKKKKRAVLLTHNPSWATSISEDKVENESSNSSTSISEDMIQIQILKQQLKVLKQQLKAPPALNQFTKTLDKNLDEFNFSALFDEEGIFPVSDKNYANQMQLQEAPKKGLNLPVAEKKKKRAVLLTHNPSWATSISEDKVENESSNSSTSISEDMIQIQILKQQLKVLKQQLKAPPALNQFTKTLDKNLGSSSSHTSALVDEFNFSALFDEEGIFPVSDENYANQMHLQEVLMSTVISSTLRNTQPSEEDIPPSKKGKKVAENNAGQTQALQSRSFCNICFEYKGMEEMFLSTTCRHTFCKECISNYVATKIRENITTISCPHTNCREGDIGPDMCREIVPKEVLDRWENVLCESLIIGSQKFYCPFKDCSVVMLDDGEEKVTSSECPNCRRLFCAQCNVAWHAGMDCSQFKSLNENESENGDILLMELAKKKKMEEMPQMQVLCWKEVWLFAHYLQMRIRILLWLWIDVYF